MEYAARQPQKSKTAAGLPRRRGVGDQDLADRKLLGEDEELPQEEAGDRVKTGQRARAPGQPTCQSTAGRTARTGLQTCMRGVLVYDLSITQLVAIMWLITHRCELRATPPMAPLLTKSVASWVGNPINSCTMHALVGISTVARKAGFTNHV